MLTTNLGVDAYGLFVKAGVSDFQIVLSNLINNAAQAIEKDGNIVVSADVISGMAVVTVSDDGHGIDEENLPKLAEQGASFNKPSGLGYGLYDSRLRVEKWGGKISVTSEHGKGTTVSIELPIAEPPKWFVPAIEILTTTSIVILGDDPSVHQIWDTRFNGLKAAHDGIAIYYFSTAGQLEEWHAIEHGPDVLYLIDYELKGQKKNGIEIIDSLGIAQNAILVTGRSGDAAVIKKCLDLNLKLVSKGSMGLVPIHVNELSASDVDCVLIDDDDILRKAWRTDGASAGKKVHAFESPSKFMAISQRLDREVPIYIDSNLSGGQKGEEAAKELYEAGFKNIYLTTGMPPEGVEQMFWIKAVHGKNPPWKAAC